MQSSSVDARLAAVFEQLVRMTRRLATSGELSLPAASVLARLAREGPQRLTELAGHEGVSQPGMTQLVSRLERDGYALRTPSPDDGRVVMVEVTAIGRAVVAQRREERASALREMLGRLEPADRRAIRAALPALNRLVSLSPITSTESPARAGARGDIA